MNNLVHAWQMRPANERRTLSMLGGVVLLVLLLAFAWLPLERSRARLAAELPRLRASIDSLERDANEVRRLRAIAPAPTSSSARTAPLASLATNGGGVAGAQITVLDERRARLAGDDVSFSGVLEWIRNAQASHGMRVESARVQALPAAGHVRAEVVLARG
jgi:type II secretory pathway component PulM